MRPAKEIQKGPHESAQEREIGSAVRDVLTGVPRGDDLTPANGQSGVIELDPYVRVDTSDFDIHDRPTEEFPPYDPTNPNRTYTPEPNIEMRGAFFEVGDPTEMGGYKPKPPRLHDPEFESEQAALGERGYYTAGYFGA